MDPRRKNPDDQPARGPVRMPVVDDGKGQKDVMSRLLQDRIIVLGQGVDDEIANQLIENNTLAPASIYFKYYLHQALVKAGLGNDYMNWLSIYRKWTGTPARRHPRLSGLPEYPRA